MVSQRSNLNHLRRLTQNRLNKSILKFIRLEKAGLATRRMVDMSSEASMGKSIKEVLSIRVLAGEQEKVSKFPTNPLNPTASLKVLQKTSKKEEETNQK